MVDNQAETKQKKELKTVAELEAKPAIEIDIKAATEELFGNEAKRTAVRMLEDKSVDSKMDKPTQVRRFYDEIALWSDKIQSKADSDAAFRDALPYIRMMKAKLAYAYGRKLLSEDFVSTFTHIINQIDSPKTLKNAKLFFEAYLGFAKAIEQQKKDKSQNKAEN